MLLSSLVNQSLKSCIMLGFLSFVCLFAFCSGFQRRSTLSYNAIRTPETRSTATTRLNAIPIITPLIDLTSAAIIAVKAKPFGLVVPLAAAAFGSILPPLIQGLTTGESIYSLLTPLLKTVEATLRKFPSIEFIIRKFVLKQKLVFEGVEVPFKEGESISNFLSLTGTSQFQIVKFLATSLTSITAIVGKEKKEDKSTKAFEALHKSYVDYAVKKKGPFDISNTLPDDYLYFGNGKNLENLPYFLRTNPFFAASLKSTPDSSFEIDPFGSDVMSELISCLDVSVPRVSATFDSKMNLKDIRVFNATAPTVELMGYSREQAATLLLYQCSYYAQNIHATTHVFHFLMTTAIVHACKDTSLESWSKPYIMNIYLKYVEVENLLFSDSGYLTGTGASGYRVTNRKKVLEVNKRMLCQWGAFKSADEYVSKFLFAGISPDALASSGVGEEFLRHTSMAGPFASAMDGEFQKDPKYPDINSKLKGYLTLTGTGVNDVSDIKTWLELMSVTGVLHGSTLSLCRLVLSHSFLSVNSPESSKFTARDSKWYSTITGTMLGTLDDFHVYSNTLPANTPYNVNRVLLEYDSQAHSLKADYFKRISEDPETFRTFGWILTDHGPNLMDGKQLTLTTYI